MSEIIITLFVLYIIGKAVGAKPLGNWQVPGPHGHGFCWKPWCWCKKFIGRPVPPHWHGFTWRLLHIGIVVVVIIMILHYIPAILGWIASSTTAMLVIAGLLLLMALPKHSK